MSSLNSASTYLRARVNFADIFEIASVIGRLQANEVHLRLTCESVYVEVGREIAANCARSRLHATTVWLLRIELRRLLLQAWTITGRRLR